MLGSATTDVRKKATQLLDAEGNVCLYLDRKASGREYS